MTKAVPSIDFQIYIEGAWASINSDVMSDPAPEWNIGIMGNGYSDRIGDPEFMTFSLDNSEGNSAGLKGYYTPGHNNARSGWTTGLLARLVVTFQSETFYKWSGKIMPDGIEIEAGIYAGRKVKVHCHGFMAQAAEHPFDLPSLALDKTIDQAVTLLLTNMPIQPLATSFETGVLVMPTVFDTVRKNTTALGEMYKFAMSEFSYIYTKGDRTVGQTLVVENRNTRLSATTLSIPLAIEDSGFMLQSEGTGKILQAGGTGRILLNQVEDMTFADKALNGGMTTAFGKNMANLVVAKTYPRKVDAAATTVLFQTQERIKLLAGETKTGVRGDYRNINESGGNVSGIEMVTPVQDTDYWMDSVENSDAKDLSSSLVVTPVYGTEGVDYTIQNTGGTDGFVYLQARGKGVYIDDVVERIAENVSSQAIHGVKPMTVELKYQNDPALGEDYADFIVQREASPAISIENYEMFANRDENSMQAFLYCEPGARAPFLEAMSAINGDYFIMGYSAKILNGTDIYWTPVTKSAGQEQSWILETSALSVDTILGYPQFG